MIDRYISSLRYTTEAIAFRKPPACPSESTIRDDGECSVDAAYRIIDAATAKDDPVETFTDLLHDVLIPAGDCLGYDE